jgi:flagellar motor switch protein FliM
MVRRRQARLHSVMVHLPPTTPQRRPQANAAFGGQKYGAGSFSRLEVVVRHAIDKMRDATTVRLPGADYRYMGLKSVETRDALGEVGAGTLFLLVTSHSKVQAAVWVDRTTTLCAGNILLGGGEHSDIGASHRPLTAMDRRITGVVAADWMNAFNAACSEHGVALDLVLDSGDLDPRKFGLVRDPVAALAVSLGLEFGERTGQVQLIIPIALLMPHKDSLAGESKVEMVSRETEDVDWVRRLDEEVSRTSVTVVAVMEDVPFTLGALACLRPGDTIPLKVSAQTKVVIENQGTRLFWGMLGKRGDAMAVRIEQPCSADHELLADIVTQSAV